MSRDVCIYYTQSLFFQLNCSLTASCMSSHRSIRPFFQIQRLLCQPSRPDGCSLNLDGAVHLLNAPWNHESTGRAIDQIWTVLIRKSVSLRFRLVQVALPRGGKDECKHGKQATCHRLMIARGTPCLTDIKIMMAAADS